MLVIVNIQNNYPTNYLINKKKLSIELLGLRVYHKTKNVEFFI